VDSPTGPEGVTELALCPDCFCVTWTRVDGSCGKCGATKPDDGPDDVDDDHPYLAASDDRTDDGSP
jgi:hypothetical protein